MVEWRANKLTASEYDETTWSARTWMAFATQRLSVVVQYSAAGRRRWPRRSACRGRPTHERRPRWAARARGRARTGTTTGYACVLPLTCGRFVRRFCIVAESECSLFSPEYI